MVPCCCILAFVQRFLPSLMPISVIRSAGVSLGFPLFSRSSSCFASWSCENSPFGFFKPLTGLLQTQKTRSDGKMYNFNAKQHGKTGEQQKTPKGQMIIFSSMCSYKIQQQKYQQEKATGKVTWCIHIGHTNSVCHRLTQQGLRKTINFQQGICKT